MIKAKRLVLTTKTGGPIAHTADRIEGQFIGTGILGSDHLAVHHTGTGNEFLARIWMRKVALVQAAYGTLTREEEFTV